MSKMNLVHKGSVKNIFKKDHESSLYFSFSNRYSVFDWGEMPDQIDHKGEALASFTYACFKLLGKNENWKKYVSPLRPMLTELETKVLDKLERTGMSHHLLGKYNGDGKVLGQDEVSEVIGVLPFQVIRPKIEQQENQEKISFSYEAYEMKPEKCLIPLEAIFRFSLPEGSGLLKRLEKNKNNREFLKDLELKEWPVANEKFERPIVEFTTKLEPTDRNISKNEARQISGMSEEEFSELVAHVRLTALCLKQIFLSKGIELQDGKFEFGMGEKKSDEKREIILLDSIGPDELRLELDGIQLSKEVLRKYYRKTEWFQKWEEFKNTHKETADWKKNAVKEIGAPSNLSPQFKKIISEMYKGLANITCEMAQLKKPFPLSKAIADTARIIREEL